MFNVTINLINFYFSQDDIKEDEDADLKTVNKHKLAI